MAAASAVFSKRYESASADHEYECGSEVSTLKAFGVASSIRSGKSLRTANSAIRVGNVLRGSSSDSGDERNAYDAYDTSSSSEEVIIKQLSNTKISRIDLSPEAVKKRQETYDKWLNNVIAREKERKRVARERHEADIEALDELREKRLEKSSEMVGAWMRQKKIEADKKIARLEKLKKETEAALSKPKEFKRAINFQDWTKQKSDEVLASKKEEREQQKMQEKLKKTHQQCRKTVSDAAFKNWSRKSHSMAKPVIAGKGLDSLRGSTTKMYVNPQPWVED